MIGSSGSRDAVRRLLTIALAILVLTWALRLVIEHVMHVPLEHRFWFRDYAGNLAFAGCAWLPIRRTLPTLAFAGFTLVAFQLCNAGKLLVLGVPASPDDFFNVANLFHLAHGVQAVAVVALLAAPFVMLVLFTRWRTGITWATLALFAVVTGAVVLHPEPVRQALDREFGNSVWNQPENFRHRGLVLHLLQESVRTAAKVGRTPSVAEVDAALEGLPLAAIDSASIAPRNVHVILLESFFDPVSLGPEWVPEDPFPAEFRALWAAAGNSVALSPVFGGYTANAEFEVLCGFPVTENAVFFEGWLRRSAPCLPNVLADAGYRTLASHPNVPGFWNRTHAYRLTGFDEYWSKADFDTSDAVGSFMLDHAFYDQLFDRLGPLDAGAGAGPQGGTTGADPSAGRRPVLNYMVTYHGHLPYPSGDAYPDQVATGRDAPLLHGYINHLWYKSRDLMARLEVLRAEDPDGLIVIFGDHLPFLDPNYGVYSEVLDLPGDRKDFTAEQFEFLVSTPLIVIDGREGPVDVGKVPLYRLPSLILDKLGAVNDGMFAWSENPSDRLYRPVYGMHFETSPDGGGIDTATVRAAPEAHEARRITCAPEAPEVGCESGIDWLARVRTLIGDTFTGKQHGLERLGGLPASERIDDT